MKKEITSDELVKLRDDSESMASRAQTALGYYASGSPVSPEDKASAREYITQVLAEREVIELALCESDQVFLKPNMLYRFVVMPDCKSCKALARLASDPDYKLWVEREVDEDSTYGKEKCRACDGDGILMADSNTPHNERVTGQSRRCNYCGGKGYK